MHKPAPANDAVDQAAFRQAMSLFATGVCVVSVLDDDDTPHGFTANSLVSVSLEPLLVCWSLQNSSTQFDLFAGAEEFAISILGQGQEELATRYAARGNALRDLADFGHTVRGLPVIEGAIATVECRHWSTYPAGDHTMIFGEVIGLASHPEEAPLGYFRGGFRKIAD
ncbi:MAG: flavin reductase family protein [Pseudomonadota bacterium]